MDINRIQLLRDNLSRDMPDSVLMKELCEHLTGKSKGYVGYNVQNVLLYLLDYYIKHEYGDEV